MNKIKILKFSQFSDKRGNLVPIEAYRDVPFKIARIFFINSIKGLERGNHAHRKCEQVLVACSGSFRVYLTNGAGEKYYTVTEGNGGIYVPPMVWNRLLDFSPDCVILVLCSHLYEESDYIRDFNKFLFETRIEFNNPKYNRIPTFDLRKQTQYIRNEIDQKINQIIDRCEFVTGGENRDFEKEFAEYCGAKYCATVSNGTAALTCAIKSLGLPPGSRIAVQANTYIAAPLAINMCGMEIEIIDVDSELNIDLEDLEKKLGDDSRKIDAVILVYLYGCCPNMDAVMQLKEKYGFPLIEDAAQAIGCKYRDKHLGTFGEVGCFSFYPSKNLGCFGEGGCIVTDNLKTMQFSVLYRNYGSWVKYKWDIRGSNERMHNLQAGILRVKLQYLNLWNTKRIQLAKIYENQLAGVPGIRLLKNSQHLERSYHLFVILVKDRKKLMDFLNISRIDTTVHYPETFYKSEAFKELNEITTRADDYKNEVLTLPLYPELEEDDILRICREIKQVCLEKK